MIMGRLWRVIGVIMGIKVMISDSRVCVCVCVCVWIEDRGVVGASRKLFLYPPGGMSRFGCGVEERCHLTLSPRGCVLVSCERKRRRRAFPLFNGFRISLSLPAKLLTLVS